MTAGPLALLLPCDRDRVGAYTAAGRGAGEPRRFPTGNFAVLALVLLLPTAGLAGSGVTTTSAGLAWGIAMGAGTTAFAYVAW